MQKKPNRVFKNVFVSVIVLLLTAGIISYFVVLTRRDLIDMSYDELKNATAEHITYTDEKIAAQYGVMSGVAEYVGNYDSSFANNAYKLALLDSALAKSGFSKVDGEYAVGFVSLDGSVINKQNSSLNVTEKNFFKDALDGKNTISYENLFEDNKMFVFAVPLVRGKDAIGVVFGAYTNDDFYSRYFDIETDTKGALLCSSSGAVLLSSRKSKFGSESESFFTTLEGGNFKETSTLDAVKANFATERVGSFEIKTKSSDNYVAYRPLGYGQLVLVMFTSNDAIFKTNEFIIYNGFLLLGALVVMFILIVVYVAYTARQNEKEIEAEKTHYMRSINSIRKLEDLSDSVIFEGDLVDNTLYFNDNFFEVYGREASVFTIEDCLAWRGMREEDGEIVGEMYNLIAHGAPKAFGEIQIKNSRGAYIWTQIEMLLLRNVKGIPSKVFGKLTNIDKQKRALENMQQRAERDQLTGLYNHNSVKYKVNSFLGGEGADGTHALFILDVDNFKHVNDNYGHFVGDEVLVGVAKCLTNIFRGYDIVGRLGGDEFCVFLKNVTDPRIAEIKAKEICVQVKKISTENHVTLPVSCSIGVAHYVGRENLVYDDLYKKADGALYLTKERGKDGYTIH